jgi:hypothetical protein
MPSEKFNFIMMTFIYKEPIELLIRTLDNIADMNRA